MNWLPPKFRRIDNPARWILLAGLALVMAACQAAAFNPGSLPGSPTVGPTSPGAAATEVHAYGPPSSQAADPPAPGLQIVFAETNLVMTSSTLYAAAVSDLVNRFELARFDHREGYTVTGRVSPDGSRVAILVVPPDAGESAARQDGGEIWMVPADGGEPQLFNARAGYILNWSPDGQILAAGRYLPAGTTGTLTPNRNEIFLVDAETDAEQVIRTENGSSALLGLGWSPDAARFYTALGISTGGWSIEAWERAENRWSQVITLPQEKEAASISLSPAGDSLLLSEKSTSGQVVSLQPLDGSPARVILETDLTSGTTGVTAVWRADGSQLMMFSASGASEPASVYRMSAANPQDAVVEDSLAAALQSRPGLVPLGWSAGGGWLVMRDYNDPALPLYLLAGDSGEARLVAPGTRGGFMTFLGWLGV